VASFQLGEIYLAEGKYTEAIKYYRISDDLIAEMFINQSYYRYDSLKYIVSVGSELYLPIPKKSVKRIIYQEAIPLYERLYSLSLKNDDLRTAMNYLITLSAVKDSLRILTRNKESIEIQTRYETERKDNEIQNLSQQNRLKELALLQTRWLAIGLGILVLLIILLAVVLIRQNRLRSSQQTLLLQQRLLRVQMNPHFMFNTLSSIQNFILRENKTAASDYLSRFSGLMRQVLYSSNTEMIPLEDEIENIDNYLALQKIRYRDLFEYTLEVDESIDQESISIPPMLAQPFIENAIEHGIKPLEHDGKILVHLFEKDQLLKLVIEDNGVGRKRSEERMKTGTDGHQSMATKLTEERIATFNRRRKNKISMFIDDLKNEHGDPLGTKVIFTFRLRS
jgi:tetratricopeptide (TPR) repeat protein